MGVCMLNYYVWVYIIIQERFTNCVPDTKPHTTLSVPSQNLGSPVGPQSLSISETRNPGRAPGFTGRDRQGLWTLSVPPCDPWGSPGWVPSVPM